MLWCSWYDNCGIGPCAVSRQASRAAAKVTELASVKGLSSEAQEPRRWEEEVLQELRKTRQTTHVTELKDMESNL